METERGSLARKGRERRIWIAGLRGLRQCVTGASQRELRGDKEENTNRESLARNGREREGRVGKDRRVKRTEAVCNLTGAGQR